ncbi:phage tail tape measure protein [Halalkalibacterium halodurans]|uniref:phage tail tape measure protein n=1 Tax=Halalkalibacterium halodurans TaxID=86665 RepID=UPI002E213617|nr:phage tail tape measure protein [Halalkalibacterium halodurans]MED4124032.1 phage tail tape measure protein [Halalkalibacterium halodurans]
MEVGALKTRISLDSAQFEQGMAGVNRQLKALQHEQKAATSSGTGFARGVNELRAKSDVLTRTLELQRAKVRELARRYEESKKATGENSKETQKAQIEYQKAVAEMNKTEHALKGITAELERQTNPWNVLSQNMTEMGTKLQEKGRQMTEFGKNWSMRVTAPIVGAGALMLKTGMDFEEGMSQVQAISGATGKDLELLEAKARELGGATTKSATEAAQGLSYMALAGWETQEMLEGLEPILRLSEAGAMDLGRASDLVTDSMSALQIQVKDLPAYLDNVAEASRSSNTSIQQLMEAYVTAGGNLAQFNVPLEESTAILGLLANRGLKGSEAGRALNAIMVNLTSGAGRAGKAMQELEISAFDADGQFIGLEETLRLVKDRTKDMTDEQKAQYISMIAGKEHLKSFQGLLAGLDEEYKDLKGSVSDADGALNDMALTMQDNAKGNVTALKSAFEELSIQFAQHMIPAFTAGVEKATELVQWFSELDDSTKGNIVTMAAFAAAIGPAAIVLGNLTTAIGGVVKIGGSLAGLLGTAGGKGLLGRIGLLGLGAKAGPVGLAIAGVGALGLAIWDWKKKTDEANKTNLELVQSLNDQHSELEAAVEKYEALRGKSEITTNQIKELLEIRHEMAKNPEAEALEELQKRYDDLVKKTGLTKDEIEELLGANDAIIEQAPQVAEAHTIHGEAVAGVGDELRNLVDTTLEIAKAEAELQRGNWAEERVEHIRNANQAEKDREETLERINLLTQFEAEYQNGRNGKQAEFNEMLTEALDRSTDYTLTQEEQNDARREADILEAILRDRAGDLRDTLKEQLDEQNGIIAAAEEHRQLGEQLDAEYLQILLKMLDINEEGQKGVDIALEKLAKMREEKEQLEEKIRKEGDHTGTLQNQLNILNGQISEHETILGLIDSEIKSVQTVTDEERKRENQIKFNNSVLEQASGIHDKNTSAQGRTNDKIDEGTQKAQEMNMELGEDVDKTVHVDDKGTAAEVQKAAEKPATKQVTLRALWTGVKSGLSTALAGFSLPGFAKGTDYHLGGPFIAGEEGWELGRMGNRWEILGPGLYSRPAGYQVFTHDESKRIMQAMQNMPAYATGARPPGEADRIVGQLNQGRGTRSVINQQITIQSPEPTSPAENARKFKQAQRQLAMEWGVT